MTRKDFHWIDKETNRVCISSYKPSAKWKRISRDEYWHRAANQNRKGVYCRNCQCLVEYGEMKPFRKDDDTVDMLCNGCDAVLVEGE